LPGIDLARTDSGLYGREFDMLKSDVQIGAKYSAKVSGRLTVVEILRERESGGYGGRTRRTHWVARNIKTGREVEIRSAAKLRSMVEASPDSEEGRFDRFSGYISEAGVNDPVLAAQQWALIEAGIKDGRIHDAALVAHSRM
jgi:hypothetical protein